MKEETKQRNHYEVCNLNLKNVAQKFGKTAMAIALASSKAVEN